MQRNSKSRAASLAPTGCILSKELTDRRRSLSPLDRTEVSPQKCDGGLTFAETAALPPVHAIVVGADDAPDTEHRRLKSREDDRQNRPAVLRHGHIQPKVAAHAICDAGDGGAFTVEESGRPDDLSRREIRESTDLLWGGLDGHTIAQLFETANGLGCLRAALGYTESGDVPPAGTRGNATWNVLPPSPLLSAQIRPPWRFTISLLM